MPRNLPDHWSIQHCNVREEPAVSYRWTGGVRERTTGWRSPSLQENYRSFSRKIHRNIPRMNESTKYTGRRCQHVTNRLDYESSLGSRPTVITRKTSFPGTARSIVAMDHQSPSPWSEEITNLTRQRTNEMGLKSGIWTRPWMPGSQGSRIEVDLLRGCCEALVPLLRRQYRLREGREGKGREDWKEAGRERAW